MDAKTYAVVLGTWADHVEDCGRAAAALERAGTAASWEYRRLKALEAGYQAAIEAAYASMQRRTERVASPRWQELAQANEGLMAEIDELRHQRGLPPKYGGEIG